MSALTAIAKKKWGFIVALCVVSALCSQRHSGFMVWIFVAPIILYQAVQAFRRRKTQERLNEHLFALCIAVGAALVIVATHVYLHITSREKADSVAAAIISFKSTNSRYPKNLNELKDKILLPDKDLMLGYSVQEEPMLVYASTFVPFAVWEYNFDTRVWEGPRD